ncbi:PREDICTED: G-type lectin S-receptor-like serine/threonine-protein kinase RLK1 [Tarenaya hassleriana]|uniref:G-type lectin S-receptor-like serine/threonine-protein kinase RLK1 n=1 Tax=Tarenaya hassleriana TaxID=28532 RepID=UPI00053C35A3|nr:PREDICTED: G-type lectin S-receptor-like serine/threonine-protein kinase RLK1 [Tarenaya hassleriana]
MLEYGNLELNVVNLPTGKYYGAYYSCKTEDPRTGPNSGFRLVYNESGELYISTRNGTNIQIHDGKGIVIPSRDFYHRVVLHFDGVFAQYYHPKTGGSNATWSMVWSKPDDICKALTNGLGSGVCGFNSVCVGENQRVSCKCVQGFSLVDKNNENGDCQPDFDSGFCNRTRNDYSYDFIRLQDVVWESSDYEEYWPYEEENCRVSCLQDCFCAVASFIGSSCRKKKYPLSNGRLDQSLDARAFIKVPKSGISAGDIPFPARNPNGKKQLSQKGLVITGYTLLGASLLLNFIILIAFRSRSHCSLADKKKDSGSAVIKSNLHVFTYKELVEATSDFRDEVGRGAFGIVYKGMIRTGDNNTVLVAVKRLDRVAQEGDKEFKNEVNVIGQTHHKNLVKLVGFCKEDQNHLLLYEFLPNGTLANFLFGHPKPVWKERTRIALGIARGILYLHEECDTQIIHCDIKPQNVLLDDHFNAKISDFGLAKLLMMNQTHTRTGIRGTKGYIAAEWFRNTPITTKVDVYSYGVLLLETICCKKAVDLKDNVILTYWAYDCFRKDRLVDLIVGDYEATDDMDTFERYVKTAIWCVQEDPTVRPNMGKVIQMLEGVTQVCVPPNPSPYDASY